VESIVVHDILYLKFIGNFKDPLGAIEIEGDLAYYMAFN
jgi:hypothetical protein